MEIAMDSYGKWTNEDLTTALANDDNFRPLFESKDHLGRTFVQEYLYKRRLTQCFPTSYIKQNPFCLMACGMRSIFQKGVAGNKNATTSPSKLIDIHY